MDGQLLQNLELIPKLRDPFLIPTLRNTSPSQKNELENNPIGSFKLLGVLIGINEPRALIQGPSGETYLLTENRKIGSQGGFVKKINPDSIVIREKETNLMGIEEIIDTPIPLGKDGKEINLNPNH
jgi:Tfp pilus assembly protein PilP